MKKTNMGLLYALLFLLFACGSDSAPSKEKIKWHSYSEGMQLAKQEEKKVFISFYADWCTFCEKMEKETFREKEVVDFVNEHFVAIRVNSEKEKDIAQKYFVRGLPMTWFLDSKGEKISSIPGYIPPEVFKQILSFVHTDSYKEMKFKEFVQKQEKKT